MLPRPFSGAACLGALLTLAPLAAQADATADAKKAIQAAYQKESVAAAKKDVKTMLSINTPDFEGTTANGNRKVTLEAMRQQMTQVMGIAKSVKFVATVQKVTLKGAEAKATVKENAEIVLVSPQDKKTHKLTITGLTEDTWVKSGKGWLRKRSVEKSSKQMIDGQAMPSSAPR